MADPLKLAVIGGGPIGLEMALGAARRGIEVQLFEKADCIAGTVASYNFVELFSPWEIDMTPLGRQVLEEMGLPVPDQSACPTGRNFIDSYLEPLCRALQQCPSCAGVHLGTEVIAVGRGALLKGESIGGGDLKLPTDKPMVTAPRKSTKFRIMVRQGDDERYVDGFDVVADCSGSYRAEFANWAGVGGTPALGERALRRAGRVWRTIPDVLGSDRERFVGRRTLVVGSGYSAATALKNLLTLRESDPGTSVIWSTRSSGDPFLVLEEDVLPTRKTLCELGNQIARGEMDGVEYVGGSGLRAVEPTQDGEIRATLEVSNSEMRTEVVHEVVTCVGYHPDASLYEELQVHQCYASDGPMKLAASLLGASGDCMKQAAAGIDTLTNPEPGFFILGSKSYGRSSAFLLKIGHQQVKEVLDFIKPE